MKHYLPFLTLLFISTASFAQLRAFQFSMPGTSDWRDTSLIALTSNQSVIDSVLADLSRPYAQRRMISGNITYGHGGHNHNAGHWFLWHFIPGSWTLADNAIELCDGRPYSDVDADTAYWVRTVGMFCPWNSKPVKEVFNITGLGQLSENTFLSVMPNPAKGSLTITALLTRPVQLRVTDAMGKEVLSQQYLTNTALDISALPGGVYQVRVTHEKTTTIKKIVVLN